MKTKRILIIDDEAGFTEMVKLNLEATGHYEVCVQNHSPEAVPSALTYRPDLIILDYVMPVMDGGDVVSKLQEDPFLRTIPVVMVTALVSNREMGPQGTVHAGGQLMLAKPISFPNLQRCIEAQFAASSEG